MTEQRIPFWAWGLIIAGGALALGALKMGIFYQRHGKRAEAACNKKKSRASYNACVRRKLKGKRP